MVFAKDGVLDRYFLISQRGSTVEKELRAGLSTFLTVAYILAVNPHILSAAGLPVKEVTTSTALSSAVATLLCGLVANLPFAVTPGMGLNAYMAFNQVVGLGIALPSALATCFTAALLVAVLALVRALSLILTLVPNAIKLATVLGMGLLLSLIGMQSSGIVIPDTHTMVGLGNLLTLKCGLATGGLVLISVLHHKGVKGSFLIGIAATALAFFAITNEWPAQVVDIPRMQTWNLDFTSILGMEPEALSAVVAYSLVMIFDIGGAMYGLANLGNLVQEDGTVPGSIATYLSAAVGTCIGAVTGTSPLIIAAESAVGIKEGGRTGLVAVVVSMLFMLSLLFVPLMQALPEMATAPVLVLVGAMMMSEAGHVDWTRMTVAVPAFLTMVVQPFTFSIANGIYAGLLFSFALFILTGDFIPYVRDLLYPVTPGTRSIDTKPGDMEPGAMHEPLLAPTPSDDHATGHVGHTYVRSQGITINGGLTSPMALSRQSTPLSDVLSVGRVSSWIPPVGSHCSHCNSQPALIHAYLANAERSSEAASAPRHEDVLGTYH